MLILWQSVVACSSAGDLAKAEGAHPLLGRIWDTRHSRMVPRAALLDDLAAAPFILLGEVHDNSQHHALQAEILRAVLAGGRRPALAMEQLDREFQPAIDAALRQPGASADTVAAAGGFDRTGWEWQFYAPLLAIATDARLPVVAINLSRNRTRDVARQGFAALGPSAEVDLALDRSWNATRQRVMDREIADGHCGKLPASALPRMVAVQRARDAVMADALISGAAGGAVVIAGDGHVRNDVGIPIYMASRIPGKRLVSVGFVEVDTGRNAAGDYVRPPADSLPFDYVWFTAAAERDDPCAGFAMPARP